MTILGSVKVVAAMFVAMFILAACGESAVGGERGAFIDRVDALCSDLDATLAEAGSPGDDAETAAFWVQVVGEFREEIRSLDAPSAELAVWELYLASIENVFHSLEAVQLAVFDGDTSRIERRVAETSAAMDHAADAADRYDMKVCSVTT